MDALTTNIPVTLSNGQVIHVEATVIGEAQVSSANLPISDLMTTIEGLAGEFSTVIGLSKATKASVKLGIEVALESGKLTALLVKGSAKANVELTLEWGSSS